MAPGSTAQITMENLREVYVRQSEQSKSTYRLYIFRYLNENIDYHFFWFGNYHKQCIENEENDETTIF